MDNSVYIRKATARDCGIIVALGKKTFTETYLETGSNPVVQEYIEKKLSDENIGEELCNPAAWFYIGFVDHEPVAFTRLRHDRVAKGLEDKRAIEVEHIYVLREYQGFKVGKEMMAKCIEVAMQEQFETIWLQVWQQNHKAIRFYIKAGFVVYETTLLHYDGDLQQHDFLMRMDLYY